MSGKSIIFVGGTGAGKTTKIRKYLSSVHPKARLVYDVNAEYTDLFPYPLTDFETFAENATKVSNALIVYEEATIFLSNRGSNDLLRDVLVRKRHTNNTIFLVFHSIRSIPRYIFDLSTHVYLHKTNDSKSTVETRFENELFTACFLRIKNAPWNYNEDTGKQYSPSELFSIY